MTFEKRVLTDKYYCDGVNCGDINRDGNMDVVAGPFCYLGPNFAKSIEFYPAEPHEPAPSPSNCMYTHVCDFNNDCWPDILVVGRVHKHCAYWYENPRGKPGPWQRHYIFERVQGETPPFADLNNDGRPEIVCHWEGRWGWLAPDWTKPTKPWSFHPITEPGDYGRFYHGEGVADINGDGRNDLLLNEGWWEQPAEGALQKTWVYNEFRFAKRGGAQILVDDIDNDGDADVITALDAHGWGLAWFEQVCDARKIAFKEHKIMGDRSEEERFGVAFTQPHALDLADIDGDGLNDIVVGKRRWAHGPKGDIEPNAAPVIYWFRLVRNSEGTVRYEPHLVDDNSGVGVQVTAADVTGDGAVDILAASKLGTFVFVNKKTR